MSIEPRRAAVYLRISGLLHGEVTPTGPNQMVGLEGCPRDEAVPQGVPRRCGSRRQEP